MNWFARALALELGLGLTFAAFGLVFPELKKQLKERALAEVQAASPELAEQLQSLEQTEPP